MLCKPCLNCVVQVVLPDECLADHVAVSKGGGGVEQDMGKVQGFIRQDLE